MNVEEAADRAVAAGFEPLGSAFNIGEHVFTALYGCPRCGTVVHALTFERHNDWHERLNVCTATGIVGALLNDPI